MATGQAKAWPVVHREAKVVEGVQVVEVIDGRQLGRRVPSLENEAHALSEPVVRSEVDGDEVA